jgi:hypothetical protein
MSFAARHADTGWQPVPTDRRNRLPACSPLRQRMNVTISRWLVQASCLYLRKGEEVFT